MNTFYGNKQKVTTIVISALVVGIFAVSCSDKKKEEAAKLEAQMKQEEVVAESLNVARVADSIKAESLAVVRAAEEEAAREEARFASPHPNGAGYTVQVDGSNSQEYAEYVVGLYSNRGYEAYIVTGTVNDETVYRVRVGNFESMAEAKSLVLELSDKYSFEPWIDQIEQ